MRLLRQGFLVQESFPWQKSIEEIGLESVSPEWNRGFKSLWAHHEGLQEGVY